MIFRTPPRRVTQTFDPRDPRDPRCDRRLDPGAPTTWPPAQSFTVDCSSAPSSCFPQSAQPLKTHLHNRLLPIPAPRQISSSCLAPTSTALDSFRERISTWESATHLDFSKRIPSAMSSPSPTLTKTPALTASSTPTLDRTLKPW